MNEDELMKMFGIDERELPKKGSSLIKEEKNKHNQTAPASISALELDAWDLSKGVAVCGKLGFKGKVPDVAMADFFAAAYQSDPKPTANCTDARRQQFIMNALETSDFQELRQSTMLSNLAAEIAAKDLADSWITLQEKYKDMDKKGHKGADREKQEEAHCFYAAASAVQKSKEAVDQLQTDMSCFGWDETNPKQLDQSKLAHIFRSVRNDPFVRQIIELAGAYIRSARGKQRKKVMHGYDDLVGIDVSGDLNRILPSELCQLHNRVLRLGLIQRIAEKRAMSRQYQSIEKLAKGPVVICVDESGSMRGAKIFHSKAFALAMAWIAQHQRRWCCLLGFSGKGQRHFLTLKPRLWDQPALFGWLKHFYEGGTDFPVPDLPIYWEKIQPPRGKTDVVLITDGTSSLQEEEIANFLKWKKKEQARLTVLFVKTPAHGDLLGVADDVYSVTELGPNADGVSECLSI